jgi:chromosome segregation ATPase
MEKIFNEQNEQVRQKQAQIETLKYELSAQSRRTNMEVNTLKQKLANVELELSSTRREADELHKATIEKTSEIGALETRVNSL